MEYEFEGEIYKVGINPCVDVPEEIAAALTRDRGFIHVVGRMGPAEFAKSLVPVAGGPFRLYVDGAMMKASKARVGDRAAFALRQGSRRERPGGMPDFVREALNARGLMERFEAQTESRQRDVLRYLAALKSPEARARNLEKLVKQLESGQRHARVP